MGAKDVVHVLDNMVEAVRPGGTVLDLQVIPPNPRVEVDDGVVCEVDGEPLLGQADAAATAVDDLVRTRRLIEEAVDDHDVLKHFASGAELVDDFVGKERRLPEDALPTLREIRSECVLRDHCRLRRLRVG